MLSPKEIAGLPIPAEDKLLVLSVLLGDSRELARDIHMDVIKTFPCDGSYAAPMVANAAGKATWTHGDPGDPADNALAGYKAGVVAASLARERLDITLVSLTAYEVEKAALEKYVSLAVDVHERISQDPGDTVDRIFDGATSINRGGERVVYAIPGTLNHREKFYGDNYICQLTKLDFRLLVDQAKKKWTRLDSDGSRRPLTHSEAIAAILDDIQYDRPE